MCTSIVLVTQSPSSPHWGSTGSQQPHVSRWGWRDPTDEKDSKHSSKFIVWILPFPDSKKPFWTIVLSKFPSKPNVALHGWMYNPVPTDLKELHPSSDCTLGKGKVTQPVKLILKGYPVFTARLCLKSTHTAYLSFFNLKLQQDDLQMFLRLLIIIKDD